jgi:hypothetical protein
MWLDSADDRPGSAAHFGHGGRTWFRAWCENRKGMTELAPGVRGRVVDLLCEHAAELVYWVPANEYRGDDFSNGEWRVNADAWLAAFNAYVATAQSEADAALDAEHCTSLDSWLTAAASGTLRSRAATGGSARLPAAQRNRLFTAAWIRQKTWPRRCRGCGESFTPDRRQAVNCPVCRSAAKGAKGTKPVVQREQPTRVSSTRTAAKGANPAPLKTDAFLLGEADALAAAAARVRAQLEANMAEIQRRLRGES